MPRAAKWQLATDSSRSGYSKRHQDDIESGAPKTRPIQNNKRFRDAIGKVVQDGQRRLMKQKLLEGMDREKFEHYRKSDEELKQIQSKKVKQFYSDQNSKLDDASFLHTQSKKLIC